MTCREWTKSLIGAMTIAMVKTEETDLNLKLSSTGGFSLHSGDTIFITSLTKHQSQRVDVPVPVPGEERQGSAILHLRDLWTLHKVPLGRRVVRVMRDGSKGWPVGCRPSQPIE